MSPRVHVKELWHPERQLDGEARFFILARFELGSATRRTRASPHYKISAQLWQSLPRTLAPSQSTTQVNAAHRRDQVSRGPPNSAEQPRIPGLWKLLPNRNRIADPTTSRIEC